MNRGLAIFSFLLILAGAIVGFYPVSILGVLLLIASIVIPSKKQPPAPAPTAPSQQPSRTQVSRPSPLPRRTMPPSVEVAPPPQMAQPAPQPQTTVQAPQSMFIPAVIQPQTYSEPLFPATMFPTMNPSTPLPHLMEREAEARRESRESRDELLDLALVALLLKLASG